jgi:hypothetical protein
MGGRIGWQWRDTSSGPGHMQKVITFTEDSGPTPGPDGTAHPDQQLGVHMSLNEALQHHTISAMGGGDEDDGGEPNPGTGDSDDGRQYQR